MKFHEEHYVDYLQAVESYPLHPKLSSIRNKLSNNIDNLNNLIFYGPPGVGKYSQALYFIKKYSPSGLKYEKKIRLQLNKSEINFKLSDIHFEIDMEILGCNSKSLWNEIYNQIKDIINSNNLHKGIILCKNFHYIHNDLLDIFYSYMQNDNYIKYILITSELSFIPEIILNKCEVINVPNYSKSLGNKYIKKTSSDKTKYDKESINIKYLKSDINELSISYKKFGDRLLTCIINYNDIKYQELRDNIYDMLIYHINLGDTLWYILMTLITSNKIKKDEIADVLIQTYKFLQFYNNNYRPIYHLEKYFYYLIIKVHEL